VEKRGLKQFFFRKSQRIGPLTRINQYDVLWTEKNEMGKR